MQETRPGRGPGEVEVGEKSPVQKDEALGLYIVGDKELLVITIRGRQRRIGPAQSWSPRPASCGE